MSLVSRCVVLWVLLAALALAGCGDNGDNPAVTDGDVTENDTHDSEAEAVCTANAVSCDGAYTTSCQGGVWVRITNCVAVQKTCRDGLCVAAAIDGDVSEGDAETTESAPDGDLESDLDRDSQDDDLEADASDGDAGDGETAEGEVELDAEREAESAVEADTDTESAPGDDCQSGDCCKNGHWVSAGEACVTGQDALACTTDTCAANHLCTHTINPDVCLIDSVCYASHTKRAGAPCLWCDLTLSATSWSGAPSTELCDDGNPCTYGETCDGNGHCQSGTALTCTNAGDACGARKVCNGSANCALTYPNAQTPCEDDHNPCTEDICSGDGTCRHLPKEAGTGCNDGVFCNGADACNGSGTCVHAGDPCQGGSLCNNSCNESRKDCFVSLAISCRDAENLCDVAEYCDGAGHCPVDGFANDSTRCDDGNPATVDDQCTLGVCQGRVVLQVLATSPNDAATTPATTNLSITFSTAVSAATLSAQTEAGPCYGSLQVSNNDFATCIAFAAPTPLLSANNTVATLFAAPGLLVNRTYKIRVTSAVTDLAGFPLSTTYTSPLGFLVQDVVRCGNSVVLSQVYGGGGSSTSLVSSDFVVLHNRGREAVAVDGWSVQYASATSSSWSLRANLSGTIRAGGHYLVQMSAPGSAGSALPTPDTATETSAMAAGAGKVALVTNTVALSGSCPSGSQIADFLGYGADANCFAGTAPAPTTSAALALFRKQDGCTDAGNNASDFVPGAPAPINSAALPFVCAGQLNVMNESNAPLEVDYCVTQSPKSLTVTAGTQTVLIYGRVYEAGATGSGLANSAIRAQLGWGLAGKNPQYETWNWINATYNTHYGNDDEYQASFTAPASGSYRYLYRFSLDQGLSWTYCDNNGSGSNDGLEFDFSDEAVLTSN